MNQPAVRTRRRDSARNQDLIIAAARAVLAEAGPDARMDAIAHSAGVGVGTVYRHFPHKQALLDELIQLILAELDSAAERALATTDGTGLEIFLFALGESFATHHGYADLLMDRSSAADTNRLRATLDQLRLRAIAADSIHPAVELGDVLTTVWGLRGVVQSSASIAPEAWRRHLDLQLAGLRAAPFPSTRPAIPESRLRP